MYTLQHVCVLLPVDYYCSLVSVIWHSLPHHPYQPVASVSEAFCFHGLI